eukprot:Gb_40740 [translate_table: standard]
MAEGLIGSVGGALAEALLHKVAQEANFVISFKNDFQWLSKKFKYFKGFLRDAGGKRRHDESVNDWVREIEDVAYDAEDILEECLVAQDLGYSRFLFRCRMGRRIKDVKDRIKSIHEDAIELKLFHDVLHQTLPEDNARGSGQTYWKTSSLLINESQTVGMEEKIETIVSWLNDTQTRVIAVVGMGGLGKTLLLQHVFKRVKESFTNSIWLSVSQNFSVRSLQCDIAEKINLNVEDVSEEAAAESIHGHLQGKRSLIVLDDVWREDRLVERIGLPHESTCKIIISSRMKEVAKKMGAHIYNMEILSEENSWKLFCFHAFPDCQQTPPQGLEGVARAIEKKCGRLPLAVKTVAASMASIKRLPNEWNFRLHWLNEVDISNDVTAILRLSYDALPSYLKPCFVYCSAFPEDSEIDVEVLINLWIAEGFIWRGAKEEQSDVACGYVSELIDRCLVEVSEEETFDSSGIKRYLKMHDLLRDLCHSISEKETRSLFHAGKGSREFPNSELCHGRRRISLMENCVRILPEQMNECPGLRTLLLSGNKEIAKIPSSFIRNLKSLRVLDLRDTSIKSLPKAVGNLKLLRVLDVSGTDIERLPESVRGLRSLQVLDVSGCRSLKRLPEGIGELKYLRHLTADGSRLQFMPRGVSKLSYMEKLMEVELKAENGLRLEDFKGLTQLRHLKVIMTNEMEMEMTWILGGLVKMRTLSLWNASKYDAPHLSEKMASLKELEILYLSGFAVPKWVCGFQNLVLLELHECDCEDCPPLETLPNLRALSMGSNESCRELPTEFGKAGGFPKLERFHLSALDLEELPKLEDGAMPRLKSFTVFDCKMLSKMPDGMERLTSLEEISVEHCEEWKAMKAGGEDWKKLKDHLPHVKITWVSDADDMSSSEL